MADVEFKLNLQELNELMKSPEMQAALDTAGEQVASIAGPEFEATPRTGRWIGFSNVYPISKAGAKDNYENNTLVKALSASGLSMEK